MIVGLTGYAQHGKDTIGQILVKEFGYKRYAFADQLKSMALVLNPLIRVVNLQDLGPLDVRLAKLVEDVGWEGAKTDPEVRRFLQVLGTEAVREHLGPNAWVDALENQINKDGFLNSGKVVITDVRFPNEAAWLQSVGGVLWRVTRVVRTEYAGGIGVEPYDNGLGKNHPSEKFIDILQAEREIVAADLSELAEEVYAAATEVRYAG